MTSAKPNKTLRLSGRVLVAHPDMQDPHFARTVVYITRHSKARALGYIMNRPIASSVFQLTSRDAFPPGTPDIPLLSGGPLQKSTFTLGMFRPGKTDRKWGVTFPETPEELHALVQHFPTYPFLAFSGLSGWGPGQLERELAEGSWTVSDPSYALFRTEWADNLWLCYAQPHQLWRKLLDYLPSKAILN